MSSTGDRNSSAGICWAAGVRFPAGARNLSLLHCAQTGSGAHTASYPGPIQLEQEAISQGVKRPGREADQSREYSVQVNNG
jgi:hypothetical protein